MTLVLASSNPGKLREMRALFAGLDIDVISKAEAGVETDAAETGETFRDNAFIKAEAVCRATGLPSVADDSGLCVDALGGAPGVHSSRFGDGTVGSKRNIILEQMRGETNRAAKFVTHIVCVFPDGGVVESAGECHGEIAHERRGENGFGYDQIFLLPDKNLTMAEISDEEKNAISHRGIAMRKFITELNKYLEEHPC